jgi:hypothetical protein
MGADVAVAVLDLSPEGVRLSVKTPLEPCHEVEVSLESIGLRRPVILPAKATWCIPAADGTYCVGLAFEKTIGYREFMALTSV